MKYYINQDHLYYSIDHPLAVNLKFTSKSDVLSAAKNFNAPVKFNWFPKLWQNYDFTKVSNKSYDELKKERALTLREKYGYLKVYFSGGSDSISVLQTFIKNGIHIDEIVNWKRSLGSYDRIDPNIENELSAIPYLKSIQHLIPKTKITIENINYDDLKKYNTSLGSAKDANRIIFGDPAEMDFVPDHKYLYLKDANSNVGHIEGGQKPNIFLYNGQWYFGTSDLLCTGFYNGAEDFFFDTENPELYMKTVHNLKDYMDNILETNIERFKYLAYNRNKKDVKKELMPVIGRSSVYDDVSLIKFHFNQHASPVLTFDNKSLRFPYIRTYEVIKGLIKQNHLIDNLRVWNDNLSQLSNMFANSIKHDVNFDPQPIIGFKPIMSTLYNLTDKTDTLDPPPVMENIKHHVILL